MPIILCRSFFRDMRHKTWGDNLFLILAGHTWCGWINLQPFILIPSHWQDMKHRGWCMFDLKKKGKVFCSRSRRPRHQPASPPASKYVNTVHFISIDIPSRWWTPCFLLLDTPPVTTTRIHLSRRDSGLLLLKTSRSYKSCTKTFRWRPPHHTYITKVPFTHAVSLTNESVLTDKARRSTARSTVTQRSARMRGQALANDMDEK